MSNIGELPRKPYSARQKARVAKIRDGFAEVRQSIDTVQKGIQTLTVGLTMIEEVVVDCMEDSPEPPPNPTFCCHAHCFHSPMIYCSPPMCYRYPSN